MKKIRLRWRVRRDDLFGNFYEDGWSWEPDTPLVRAAFQAAVDAGNRAHGTGTHWIEQEPCSIQGAEAPLA